MSKNPALGAIAGLTLSLVASSSNAATTVNVVLQDPSTGNGVTKMELIPSPDHAKAGRITFAIHNESKGLVHEMLLIKAPPPGQQLPYDAKSQRLIEANVVKLEDSDDVQPGKSVTKTVRVPPGQYLMVCNQEGHFMQGMSHPFLVTK
ncbi:MAG TPA: hypothetical protein VFA03_08765 [Acetobacteraceae bacterium]|nr:hypothetical protein [Acetobacteraceae bacterium]